MEVKKIVWPAVPWATSVPSTVRLVLLSNWTTVPGWTVSVFPAGTLTLPTISCTEVFVHRGVPGVVSKTGPDHFVNRTRDSRASIPRARTRSRSRE